MPVSKVPPVEKTLSDLRDCFRKWQIELFEVVPREKVEKGYVGPGMRVSYFRADKWQSVECMNFPTKASNVRQCFLLLDRLRIAEQQGVSYAGLSSTTELIKAGPEVAARSELVEAYGIVGVAPDDPDSLLKQVYRAKSMVYHPDVNKEDEDKMKRLNNAYEVICKARGIK